MEVGGNGSGIKVTEDCGPAKRSFGYAVLVQCVKTLGQVSGSHLSPSTGVAEVGRVQ